MTKDTKAAIVGKLTLEYSDVKHQVNLLETSLRQAAEKLQGLPVIMRRADPDSILKLFSTVDFQDIRQQAESLKAAHARAEELKEELRRGGVSL